MSVAMVLSAAIHGVAFLVAGWLISDMAEPSISTALLTVSIRPSQAWDDRSAETISGDHTATRESSVTAMDRVTDAASVRQATNAAVTERWITTDNKPLEPTVEDTTSDSSQQALTDLGQKDVESDVTAVTEAVSTPGLAVVTTNSATQMSASTAAVMPDRPAFARTALTPTQEKMLTRKFEEWTENFHKLPDADADLNWKYKGQEYVATFTDLIGEDDMGIQQVLVEVSTEQDGKRLSTEMRMKRLAFSSYAQFVNRWDPDVQIHNDEFEGRFHSNTRINLAYNRKVKPQFRGEVTTSARGVNILDRRGYVGRDQIFLGGLQTGVKAIRWPEEYYPLPSDARVTDKQIQHFDKDTRLTFYGDGSYVWRAVRDESLQHKSAVAESTTYLIAAKDVTVYVKGTVNGKVLIYSPQRIVIEDDLLYASNPVEVPGADDYLGLVSDKYVEIAPPDITGPGDLVINAAIYAKRRFVVKRYRARNAALLYIYGSLTAGSLSATEPRFHTKIVFDQRLDKLRPPGFPMANRFVVDFWDSAWKVESNEVLH